MSDDRPVEDPSVEHDRALLQRYGQRLVDLARASVLHGFEFGRPLPVHRDHEPPELAAIRATHVILRPRASVAGIEPARRAGGVRAWRPLLLDVAANAYAATFADQRHAPLKPTDRFDLAVTILLLGAPQPLALDDPRALAQGDGALLEWEGGSQVLFPEAWAFATTPGAFLAEALRRAHGHGLADGIAPRAYRFSVSAMSDANAKPY